MTEKEAERKWCPFVRLRGIDTGAYNRYAGVGRSPEVMCIASDCACWVPYGNQKNPMAKAPAKGEGRCGLIKS